MTNPAYEATNSDVRLIARTKQLSSLMAERFSMNPISAKILREDWEKEFPDHEAVAQHFNALIAAMEQAQQYAKKRDDENQDLMLTIGRLRVEREQLDSAPNGMMQPSNELAEMKRKCAELQEQKDKWSAWAMALGAKADELESQPLCVKSNDAMREAAPLCVKLPMPYDINVAGERVDWAKGDNFDRDEVIKAIRAAGGTVEGD